MTNDKETWNHESTLNTFLNEPAEVHMMIIGFYTAWTQWKLELPENASDHNRAEYDKERPYFCAGALIGRLMQIYTVIAIIVYVLITMIYSCM